MDQECTAGVGGAIKPKKKRKKREGPTLQSQYESAMMRVVCIPEATLLQELEGFRAEKKYAQAWVMANFCNIMNKFPPRGDVDGIEPSEALRAWFKLKSKAYHVCKAVNKKVQAQIDAWNEPMEVMPWARPR